MRQGAVDRTTDAEKIYRKRPGPVKQTGFVVTHAQEVFVDFEDEDVPELDPEPESFEDDDLPEESPLFPGLSDAPGLEELSALESFL
ncbi:MAG: hypothetical protein ACE5GA_09180 [Candidatus Zixiibacteriota bacterium]